MVINYAGRVFTDATKLTEWKPPQVAGLYVILKSSTAYPKSFYDLIYVGQAENLADRNFDPYSEERKCWLEQVNDVSELSVAMHAMPDSKEIDRRVAESGIIEEQKPPCNKQS